MAISKNGTPLHTLADWEKFAGPKSTDQWVDGRSAMEAARAWLEGDGMTLPPEITKALASHSAFGTVINWDAEPEAKLSFDAFPGEPRNSDLVVYIHDTNGQYVMAVEAKADETFGGTVTDTFEAALERFLANNRSNGIERIKQLTQALLGPKQNGEMRIGDGIIKLTN